MGTTALTIENVTVTFGGVKALDGLSVEVESGSIHGVMGPNGSGKTTLLNCISGFVPARTGRVVVEGRPVVDLPPDQRARLGIGRTFQHAATLSRSSVIENVLIGLHSRDRLGPFRSLIPWKRASIEGRNRAQARALLDGVGLSSCDENSPARTLSYGQQRMLDLARALAGGPSVVLVDEPTAGLGPTDIEVLRSALLRTRAAGITIVIVEHHVRFLSRLCDRVTVVDFGRKIAEGSFEDVTSNPDVVTAYLGPKRIRG